MNLKLNGLLTLMVGCVIGLTAQAQGTDLPKRVILGVYQSDKATVMYESFTPIVGYLEKSLLDELGRPVSVWLKIFKTYEEGKDALVKGQVDFVRFGPASYIMSKSLNPDIRLIAMELNKSKKRFKGIIFVRTDSPIQSLTDLKGKRFAFGDSNSTIGRYLAQAEMVTAGLSCQDLADYDYLLRHDIVAKAVLVGDYDAGSIKDSTFNKYNEDGELRVLKDFDNVTKPWIAKAGMPEQVFLALRKSLIGLHDPETLKALKVSGFTYCSDEDYEPVREGMQLSHQFDPSMMDLNETDGAIVNHRQESEPTAQATE
ncbi:MAG: PhnD/SsuA/transferrin family substrate-binding protein [Phycisphaerae bacterium]|nr:PhnD/SsuA/transferrin family substrate-binding protein [Phycisphaerae bacterium]